MSTVAVEHPYGHQTRPFATTVGFQVQGGFQVRDVHTPAAAPAAPAPAHASILGVSGVNNQQTGTTRTQLLARDAELTVNVPQRLLGGSNLSSSLSSSVVSKQAGFLPDISASFPGVPASPGPVGWQGLLEYSETSGCAGVLGPKTTSDDLDSTLPARLVKLEVCCTAHTSPPVRRLVKAVIRGLRAAQEPDKAADGMGGTYFYSNEQGAKVAIFKPCDEECLAPNNPKGYVGRQLGDPGWKPTVRVGEAALREVAAYLLDHDRWARVPTSVLVRARHPAFCYNSNNNSNNNDTAGADGSSSSSVSGGEGLGAAAAAAAGGGIAAAAVAGVVAGAASGGGGGGLEAPGSPAGSLPMKLGSLQEFVVHDCDTSEMGPGRFSVRDVHRIGILDVRLFNTDRHAGNMLVRTPRASDRSSAADLRGRLVPGGMADCGPAAQYELIPIDHGFCLPETLEAPYFEWLHWPQTMLPFSEEELAYIRELDVEKDKALLQQELPMLRPECLRVLEVCTALLKACAAAGLTLFDIASVMSRPFVDADEEPSELERMCAYARQCVEYTEEISRGCSGADAGADGEDQEGDTGNGDDDIDDIDGDVLLEKELLLSSGELEEEGQLPGSVAACAGAGVCGPRRGGTISSIKEEAEAEGEGEADGMLFDLSDQEGDGDDDGHRRALRPRPHAAGGTGSEGSSGVSHSPSSASTSSRDLSRASSLSSSSSTSPLPPRGPSTTTPAIAAPPGTGAVLLALRAVDMPGPPRPGLGPQPPSAAPTLASSVHVTDGLAAAAWRKLQSRQAAKRAAGAKGVPKRAGGGGARNHCPVYPPPVAAFSPERMSRCFSGMGEQQWGQFMGVLMGQVEEALAMGSWRQAAADMGPGGMAASCPRF